VPDFLKNWRLMLILGLVLGLAALVLFGRAYRDVTKVRPVVKASGDIQAGEKISKKNLKQDEVSGALPEDAVTRPEEILDLAAKGFIPGDTVLRKSMFQEFAGEGVEGELARLPGYLGVAFAADIYTTVGGNVLKGSVVTVSIVNKAEKKAEDVGENVKVLSAGGSDKSDTRSVTLALTKEQYARVKEALAGGCTFIFALQSRS
jgi:Flp pilus assembly protein CpaB